jgi:hypothetical protein
MGSEAIDLILKAPQFGLEPGGSSFQLRLPLELTKEFVEFLEETL